MAYSSVIKFAGQSVRICACGVYADGWDRGTQWVENRWGESKRGPLNRWLCEQCVGNARDVDAKIRRVKRQVLTPVAEGEFLEWYEEMKVGL